jgi:metal-responsive CopG/Arc/MetJ family transcriptional regulator
MAKRRITVDFDEHLLQHLDAAAAEACRSRNQFLTDAVERVLREVERRPTDAAFDRMAEDAEYQAELLTVEQELSPASDAAWRPLDLAEQRPPASGYPGSG